MPRQLNAHTITALPPPPTGQAFYFDSKVKGLALRIGASGAKSWTLTARLGGRPFRYVLGPYPAWELPRARAAALAAQAQVASGNDPRRPKTQTLTLGELLENYSGRKTRSITVSIARLRRGLPSSWLGRPTTAVTRDEVEQLRQKLAAEAGPYASNGFIRHLRALYNWGVDMDKVPYGHRNPAARLDKFPEHRRRRILHREEFPRLFDALRAEPNVVWRVYFAMPLLIGTRRNELLEAKWSDVDLDGPRPLLRIPQNKADRPLELPLVPEAVELLRALPRYNEYVFPSKRGGHLREPQVAWQRIRTRANLPDVHIHDLRRTCSSLLGHRGKSLALIGAVLNHADQQTTKDSYVVWEDDPVREALTEHAKNIMTLVAK